MFHIVDDRRDLVLLMAAQHRLARVKPSGILVNILKEISWGSEGSVLLGSVDVAVIKGRVLNLWTFIIYVQSPGGGGVLPNMGYIKFKTAAWLAQLVEGGLLCGRSRVRAPDRTNTQGL